MPTPAILKAPFYPNCFYHLTCKSADGLSLFLESRDYETFKKRFHQFTYPFLLPWSYSLLNNHSHHIVKINSHDNIIGYLNEMDRNSRSKAMDNYLSNVGDLELFDSMLVRIMNSFLVSYANYINNKYERTGGLFQRPFKRIEIHDDSHLQQAIIYVNANAQKHNLVHDFKGYKYTSYHDVLAGDGSFIDINAVLGFFGSRKIFIEAHKQQVDYFYKHSWPNSKLE